jgi:O-acetyl-ADP-ribose deacetylase (regulator of RNase III)
MKYSIGSGTIEVLLGDITQQNTDAIVNAANTRLSGGSGVDGAIHKHGGPKILEDTRRRYPMGCQTGDAVISEPGDLPCRFVIHAVGPIWHNGATHEAELLERAYLRSLEVAEENDCDSIAFPAISCGAYAYPIEPAARIAFGVIRKWLAEHDRPTTVRFVMFTESAYAEFVRVAEQALSNQESASSG